LFGTLTLFFGVNLFVSVYNIRYPFMIVPAMALFAGAAIRRLPARAVLVAVIGGLGILTHPAGFKEPKAPNRELMQTVSEHYQPGDRVWYNLSPNALGSTLDYERAYYLEHVAPNLNTDLFVWDAPNDFGDAPRIWDVRPYWVTMPANVEAMLTSGWTASEAYTFGAYTVRLYEAPPKNQAPVTFADVLAMQVSSRAPMTHRAGETLKIKTWWQALDSITLDYSYGLYLRDGNGVVLAQNDDGLVVDDQPTSQWQPDADYRFATLDLSLPADLPAGVYSVWLAVYYWEDPQPLLVSAPADFTVDGEVVRMAEVTIE
jgi:hypothetical protein